MEGIELSKLSEYIQIGLLFVATISLVYSARKVLILSRGVVLPAYLHLEAKISSDEAREQRKKLYEVLDETLAAPSDKDRKIIESVCVPFDIMGVLVEEKLITKPIVYKPFYDVIIKVWTKTSTFIEAERKIRRHSDTYMMHFETLYKGAMEYSERNKFGPVEVYEPEVKRRTQ